MNPKYTKPTYFTNVENYFSKVDVYSKIVSQNYMHHVEIFGELKLFLKKEFGNKPFKLLELGCGNAFFISQVLKDTNIELYTAYDLSGDLINEAKKNMNLVNCQKDFIVADLSKEFLNKDIKEKYDVIWSSFMLHHLTLSDKERFFKKCLDGLNNNSYFIFVDVVNDYNSREEFLTYWKDRVETHWTILNNQDKEYVYDHVFNYDFPENFAKYQEIAKDASFKNSRKVFQKDHYAYMMFKC